MGEGQICQFRSTNNYALRFLANSRFLVLQSVSLHAEKPLLAPISTGYVSAALRLHHASRLKTQPVGIAGRQMAEQSRTRARSQQTCIQWNQSVSAAPFFQTLQSVITNFHWICVCCVTALVRFCSAVWHLPPAVFWVRHGAAMADSWSCKIEESHNHSWPQL